MFNNFLELRTMTFPSAFRHYKPRSKKTSGIIAISDECRILLVKGRERNKWSFPKGHLKGSETIHQCALRECYEETGVSFINTPYVFACKLVAGEYFIYKNVREVELTVHDTDEICDIAWVTIDDMKYLKTNIDVSAFIRRYDTLIRSAY